jgi:ribosome maturation factor RimP
MGQDLEAVVNSVLDALDFDLVLVRRGGTRSRPTIEIRIDRRDGERVSVGDCVRASRAIEARLDAAVDDAVPFGGGRYELQVSSPGDARRGTPAPLAATEQGTKGARGSADDEHTDDGSRDGRFD